MANEIEIYNNRFNNKELTKKNKIWIAVLLIMVPISLIGIILLINKFPTATRISEVVKKESSVIAQKTREDILKDAREDHEKQIVTLADSAAVRKIVYRDALDQAAKKGYIFPLDGYIYLTNNALRDEKRLLTEAQRKAIEKCLTKHLEEKDSYNLMYYVLSDKETIEALRKNTIRLTPYDLIGVVGGYIGEIVKEQPELKRRDSKSVS